METLTVQKHPAKPLIRHFAELRRRHPSRPKCFVLILMMNVKTIAFGNKENTTDLKMEVSVLLLLFISSNEVCNTAYAL